MRGLDTPDAGAERRVTMPQGEEVFLGLNKTGVIVFIILVVACLPLCWIPFIVDSMKAEKKSAE